MTTEYFYKYLYYVAVICKHARNILCLHPLRGVYSKNTLEIFIAQNYKGSVANSIAVTYPVKI